MRKYNPALKGMVDNYRQRIELEHPNNLISEYSDEELYKVIDYWSGMSTPEEQFEAVVDDILCGNKH